MSTRAGSQERRLRSGRDRAADGSQQAKHPGGPGKGSFRVARSRPRIYTTYSSLNPSQPSAAESRTFVDWDLCTQRKRLRTLDSRLQRADAESSKDSKDNWQVSGFQSHH